VPTRIPVIIGQAADHGLRFLRGTHSDPEGSSYNARKRL